MNKKYFLILIISILIISIIVTYYWGCNDPATLFLTCLGALSTLATLYVAYEIFINYSATADIQKKQFNLVDEALAFFTTKRFYAKEEDSKVYYCFLTKNSLDYLKQGLINDNKLNCKVLISEELFEFFLDFRNKTDPQFFPFELRNQIVINLPQMVIDLSNQPLTDKILLIGSHKDENYGTPYMGQNNVSIDQFIDKMNFIRNCMQTFLNNQLHKKYRIKDEDH